MTTKLENLPLDKLPEFWTNEIRLNVLFGPFRSRQVNAQDWDAKLEFWKESIQVYCNHNKKYSFKLKDLQEGFKYKGRSPACLPKVLEELRKTKSVMSKDEFLEAMAVDNGSWANWATDLLFKRPMKWSLEHVGIGWQSLNFENTEYVNVDALKRDSPVILQEWKEKHCKKRVVNVEELDGCNKELSLHLRYLQHQGLVSLREVKKTNNERIVLLKLESKDNKLEISDVDVDVYMLSETGKVLSRNLETLEDEMQSLLQEIKKQLKKGHKQLAKTILRKKHDIERRIEARSNALYNVETLQSRLEDSQYDKEVLQTYKSALQGLRANFNDGLNEDTVTNTMLELSETLDIHNDIQSTLAQSVTSDNDSELEAELAALMAEPVEEEGNDDGGNASSPSAVDDEIEKELEMLKLPDVPTDEPSLLSKVLN